jgi:hypothetical protein
MFQNTTMHQKAALRPHRQHESLVPYWAEGQFTVAAPQHFLYFFPEPHGHGSFRLTLGALGRGSLVWAPETDIIRALYYVWRSRAGPRELKHRTT